MEADGKVGLKVHLYSSSIAALVKSGMTPWRALLLVLLSTNRAAAECCRAKTVGGIEYVLQEQVSSSQLESFGCLDGCIYQVVKAQLFPNKFLRREVRVQANPRGIVSSLGRAAVSAKRWPIP